MKTNDVTASVYSQLLHENMNQSKEDMFKQSLLNQLQSDQPSSLPKSNALSFENIQGLTDNDIDVIFSNEQSRAMALNLKLATQFSSDPFLAKPLFNTVFSKDLNSGYEFLSHLYEDKKIFLDEPESLGELLELSIKSRGKEKKITDKIAPEDLDMILTHVNSFNFVNALTNNTSNLKDKYQDDENYSLLFGDYHLEYEKLKIAYEDEKYKQMNMIKQF
jgi:hypothetical protein